jgi:hypothetical protein
VNLHHARNQGITEAVHAHRFELTAFPERHGHSALASQAEPQVIDRMKKLLRNQ